MLTEELRDFILKITEDPLYIQPSVTELPPKLNLELRKYFITQLRTRKDEHAARIFDEQIELGKLDEALNTGYNYLINKCGISDEEELYMFLKELIDNILREEGKGKKTDREKLENPVDEAIFQSLLSVLKWHKSEHITDLIEYGKRNSLFYWNGEKWSVTNLGSAFIKLSPLQAIKFLLLMEIHQSGGKSDVWHVSRDYIEWIYKTKNYSWNFVKMIGHQETYVKMWIKRLKEMGIIEDKIFYSDPFRGYEVGESIKLTKFGEVVIKQVLDSEEDPLSTFIEILYRQELNLSYDLLSHYSNHEVIEKLQELFSKSEITKGQEGEIGAGLKAFQDMNYISSLKTLIPAIEGVLRNIYVDRGIGGTDKDLEPMLQELRSNKWINKETESLINSLGRSKKVHGLEGISEQEAQIFSVIALKALEDIHKDFYFFRGLRMCFEKIAEKNEHLSAECLLSAYPKKRNEVHIQVREHTLDTNYKQIELLCTLPKYEKIYKCRVNLEKDLVEVSEGIFEK